MPLTRRIKPMFSLNPVAGCTIGCPYCYARVFNLKYPQVPLWEHPQFFPARLKALGRRSSSAFFLTTMSDPSVWKPEWVLSIMEAVRSHPRHTYLFLTKRPNKLLFTGESPNIWIGCTVTRPEDLPRVDALRRIPAHRRFISFEPLHADIGTPNWEAIDWVWIGAETGGRPDKIACRKEWVESLIRQCRKREIPFYLHRSLHALVPRAESRWHPDFIIENLSLF